MNAFSILLTMAASCAGLLLTGIRADAAIDYAPVTGEYAHRSDLIYLADEAEETRRTAVAWNKARGKFTGTEVHTAVVRTDAELENEYSPFALRGSPVEGDLRASGESPPFVRGNERNGSGPGNRARITRPRPRGPRIGARREREVPPCPERCHYRLIERGREEALPAAGTRLPGTPRPVSRFTADHAAAARECYRPPRPRRSFVQFRITIMPEESI